MIEFPATAKPTVPKDMISKLRLSEIAIVLEKTKLAAVQTRLGGTIGRRGDAGESLAWLCFHGAGDGADWVLWLMSGEIDAGTVGGFRWQRVERTVAADAKCQVLLDTPNPIKLPIALRLGMPEGEVMSILGAPSARLGSTLFYLHEHEQTIRNEPHTEMNTLSVQIYRGVVSGIEVWKSTTS